MKEIIVAFKKLIADIGIDFEDNQIYISDLGCPHNPNSLPKDMMAVYSFWYKDECLKIGKVSVNSNNRFRYQHYRPLSSNSNLANSILSDRDMKDQPIDENNVGHWIKTNTRRVDIYLDKSLGIKTLNLLEAYLQCAYEPKYEGFNSQKTI